MPERTIYRKIVDIPKQSVGEMHSGLTPSEEFEKLTRSHKQDYKRSLVENSEVAELSAYTAKPFMDIAVDIYKAEQLHIERLDDDEENNKSNETKLEIMRLPGIKELITIAERHAQIIEQRMIISKFGRLSLTFDKSSIEVKPSASEQIFLDAMGIVAEYYKTKAKADLDAFWNDENPQAIDEIVSSLIDISEEERLNLKFKIQKFKTGEESYFDIQNLSDTSDNIFREIGQKAVRGKSPTSNEMSHLNKRLDALKEHTQILNLISKKYGFPEEYDL